MPKYRIGFIWIALVLLILLVPAATILSSGQYAAYAGGIQAIGVILTLYVAAATLTRDSKDGRVDRVLNLHSDLVGGDIGAARSRLGRWIRSQDMKPISRRSLQSSVVTNPANSAEKQRYEDLHALLRLFERIDGARLQGALDADSAVLLLGPHAAWWDRAIEWDDTLGRKYLHSFARWCYKHVEKRKNDVRFSNWNEADRDFPNVDPATLERRSGHS